MKRGLKVLGLVAMSTAVSTAVVYALEQFRKARGFAPPDWYDPDPQFEGDKESGKRCGFCGAQFGDGLHHAGKQAVDPFAGQCHHMPGCHFCGGLGLGDLSDEEKAKYFCPYGGIPGCDKTAVGTDGVTCKYVGGPNCPGVTYNPAEGDGSGDGFGGDFHEESAPEGFCPYNEVGCLSPKDFDEGTTVCPCAGGDSCLRKHTFTKPGDDAFGGEYGGHGLHAEEVAFEGKDLSGDDTAGA